MALNADVTVWGRAALDARGSVDEHVTILWLDTGDRADWWKIVLPFYSGDPGLRESRG